MSEAGGRGYRKLGTRKNLPISYDPEGGERRVEKTGHMARK